MIKFDGEATNSLCESGNFGDVEQLFDSKLDEIESAQDLGIFIGTYLDYLGVYRQLADKRLDVYLSTLSYFVDSPAALRELSSETSLAWRDLAKILIYCLDRD